MLESYFQHVKERETLGIPPLPLTPEWTAEVCRLLENPPAGKEEVLLELIKNRVAPGVDPAAKVKAEWLTKIANKEKSSPIISPKEAVFLLGTMLGGYNVEPLIALLSSADDEIRQAAVAALSQTTLVYGAYNKIKELAQNNEAAATVFQAWAEGKWFLERPPFPEKITCKVFRVDGEVNTDDLSPAKHAWSRPDIPLHALSMGETRFPGGIETIKKFREEGYQVAFVADVVGTGSSRKSATNSLLWHIGQDIPYIPNKRRGGVVIGGLIAPIFFNTVEDSGGLPLMADVSRLQMGDIITIDFKRRVITNEQGEVLSEFNLKPPTLPDEFRAGGRLFLIIGRNLTDKARQDLNLPPADFFTRVAWPKPKENQGYSLAQKIVGRACGVEGILPGTACEPKMTTVGSQDTTGPMTADELKELACLEFQSELFMQSFCHTAAYPKPADVKMHQSLSQFVIERRGVALRPGDGVIHSWLNRIIIPDTMGTAGDSHTRFPIGLSFPAGSGLVAFAGTLGFMPLDMPESVLVRFRGKLRPGITLRDVVNAIPYFAIKEGLLTVAKEGKKNVFNGRLIEMEGLPDLTVEQAFELTDATAERSAAGGTIALSEETVARFLRSNVALLKKMIEAGYQDADALQRRIEAMEAWLANPQLLRRDENAEFAAVLEINLDEITEPILACPNDPDDVRLLSEVAGDKIDEIFIGSCMTNIGHFRAAGKIFEGVGYLPTRIWLTPPTKMDRSQLMKEGYYSIYASVGARTEIPGCSLCMGNQARVRPGATIISTSTRNFDNRMGDGARVYLGSAEVAAVAALLGRLPTPEEYFKVMEERVLPLKDEIYRYLQFDEMADFTLDYLRD
ncbi:bifunctional aconitate hydratase 2/2-methylisocitrate dehydratase [Candidatus Aminicenantes bacterium AC-334-K16]|nr:bifunctional aconitate hydratase 2/2-methylisocitrate dehydratase [Candidatus Aminicenantes bacterium AC-334-K16]